MQSDDTMKTRNKIILLVAITSLAAYLSLTISPVVGFSLLAVSPLLLCLATCVVGGVIGGATWFSRSKTKQRDLMGTDKRKSEGCC